MTRDQLLAEADAVDRQADAIFRSIDAQRDRLPIDELGFQPLIPAGREPDAQRASDLRRRARTLRADADDLLAADPTPSPKTGASSAPATPPLSPKPFPAAGSSIPRKRPPVRDLFAEVVARILKA